MPKIGNKATAIDAITNMAAISPAAIGECIETTITEIEDSAGIIYATGGHID